MSDLLITATANLFCFGQVLASLADVGSGYGEAVLTVLRARREEIRQALVERTNNVSSSTLQDFDWQIKVNSLHYSEETTISVWLGNWLVRTPLNFFIYFFYLKGISWLNTGQMKKVFLLGRQKLREKLRFISHWFGVKYWGVWFTTYATTATTMISIHLNPKPFSRSLFLCSAGIVQR